MPIVAAAFVLAALVWGAVYARRGSVVVGCVLLLVGGYVFGHEFWSVKVGPLPVTLDRLLLGGLLAALVVQWRMGQWTLRPLTSNDWMLGALLAIFAISAVLSGHPEITDGVTSKWGRLVAAFVLPAVLYFIVRQVQISKRDWLVLLAGLAALGVYLGGTAILEVGGRWSLVFPRYIADPNLGIHFGRARGPELNSVSVGLYLTACLLCAWTLSSRVSQRWQQLVLFVAIPLMAVGVLLTYTRSTWIGLAASVVVVVAINIPRHWRMPAFGAAALVGLLLVMITWGSLVGLKREGSAADSEHSVGQRKSFAYVSWQMFLDHPVFGVGFGRFYDQKLPYLSDRSQDFELESIRPLHHHNTLLSVLTETGLVGLAAFVGVFFVWIRSAWSLAGSQRVPLWVRAQGVLMLALLANYFCSAVFHDLTLIPSQHLLLFFFAGLTVNLQQVQSGYVFQRQPTCTSVETILGKPAVASC